MPKLSCMLCAVYHAGGPLFARSYPGV